MRRRNYRSRTLRALAVMGLAAASCFVQTTPASATVSGIYSIADEHSAGTAYSGLKVTRQDASMTPSGTTNCSNIYAVPVVYQTQWARFPVIGSSPSGWVEIGTAHKCTSNTKYWFWGYGYGNAWYQLGTQGPVGVATHTFQLKRVATFSWHMYVDSTDKGMVYYNTVKETANALQTGLETYDGNAVIPSHTYSSLSRAINDGSYVLWSGFDGKSVDSGLCGGWNTASQWRASENAPC